jgi:hypothetical protein
MDLVCWLGVLHNIFASIFILVSGLCMVHRNFFCLFSCYLPSTNPGLRHLYSYSYTDMSFIPCGGGFEYFHCSPASRRRRRKGKSRIGESKIWSRVPRDSDPRMTSLAWPAAVVNDTPVLSSERAPHVNKLTTGGQ